MSKIDASIGQSGGEGRDFIWPTERLSCMECSCSMRNDVISNIGRSREECVSIEFCWIKRTMLTFQLGNQGVGAEMS